MWALIFFQKSCQFDRSINSSIWLRFWRDLCGRGINGKTGDLGPLPKCLFRKISEAWIDPSKFKSVFTCVNMCPFLTRLVPLESFHSQLSNGTNFIKNGYILRKSWRNRSYIVIRCIIILEHISTSILVLLLLLLFIIIIITITIIVIVIIIVVIVIVIVTFQRIRDSGEIRVIASALGTC